MSDEAKNFLKDLDGDLGKVTHISTAKKAEEVKKEEVEVKKEEVKKDDDVDDDEPIFKKKVDEKKKEEEKKGPDESIAILRKQRDEERDKNKGFTEVFGEHKPSVVKPLLEFITAEADGPITEEYVSTVIKDLKEQKKRISELELVVVEKERKVADIDIRHSDDFKRKYEVPYKEALDTLFLEFATVTPDKKIIAPETTKAFHKFLIDNPEIDGVSAKAELAKFAESYRKESGEEPTLPSVTALMTAIRKFKSAKEDMSDAYTNWDKKKKDLANQFQADRQIQTEAQQRANKKLRVNLATKAFNDFDLDETPFIKEEELQELFKEEFSSGEKIFNGEKVPEMNHIYANGVKARLWDKYLATLKQLMEFKEEYDEAERSGVSGKRKSVSSKQAKADWLTGV